MPAVYGNIKTNKIVLQGHGLDGTDVSMDVVNDQFNISMNDDVLMSVGKDDTLIEGNVDVDDSESVLKIKKQTIFTEPVIMESNVTIMGKEYMKYNVDYELNETSTVGQIIETGVTLPKPMIINKFTLDATLEYVNEFERVNNPLNSTDFNEGDDNVTTGSGDLALNWVYNSNTSAFNGLKFNEIDWEGSPSEFVSIGVPDSTGQEPLFDNDFGEWSCVNNSNKNIGMKILVKMSSEGGYDFGYVNMDDEVLFRGSGGQSQTLEVDIKPGSKLTIFYSKDYTVSSRDDVMYFKIVDYGVFERNPSMQVMFSDADGNLNGQLTDFMQFIPGENGFAKTTVENINMRCKGELLLFNKFKPLQPGTRVSIEMFNELK
jgi:hypothetical protein